MSASLKWNWKGDKIKMDFLGERIKLIRKEKGISQYQLAEKIQVLNQSQISKMENQSRKITAEELMLVAEALGVSAEDFMRKEDA